MKVQVSPLSFGETTDIDRTPRLDTHPFKRRQVRDWRDYKPAGILKADESAVKQVIDAAFFLRYWSLAQLPGRYK